MGKLENSEIYPFICDGLDQIPVVEIRKGAYVARAVNDDDTIYYVLKGSVRVVKETMTGKRIFVDSCEAENFTGHISNLADYDLNCDIVAETDLILLKLERKIMHGLMENPEFACFFYRKTSDHLYTMVKRFLLKTLFTQKQLVSYYILDNEYQDYFVYKSMYRNCENLRISRAGFYNMLNQLMKEGVLEKDAGVRGYRILDREKLEQQASGVQRFLNRKK